MKKSLITALVSLSVAASVGDRADALSPWLFETPYRIIVKKIPLPKPRPAPLVDRLSAADIEVLSMLATKPAGVKRVGEKLGKLNLSNDILEDTWMRIAVHQGKITRTDAQEMFERLSGVPGFGATLRKICGSNTSGTTGHLNELVIAQTAVKHGFEARAIGMKFNDPAKSAETDIDVVLGHHGTIFAIEAKKYSTRSLPMDSFRADMDTLVEFRKSNEISGNGRVIPVFSMSQVPQGFNHRILEHEARKRDVQLVIGTPEEQVLRILHFSRIM